MTMSSECRCAVSRSRSAGRTAPRPSVARTSFSFSSMTVRGRRVVPVAAAVPSVPTPISTTSPTMSPRSRMFMPSVSAGPPWPAPPKRRVLPPPKRGTSASPPSRRPPPHMVGARLYHVLTDWDAFWPHHLADVVKIWEGGLGIWGAVLGGMLGTWIGCRRVRLPFWRVADSIAPGLILAQALGRWGNYANQELYGHPSSLPWAVKIDRAHRYAPYGNDSTFQPMFL